MAAPILYDFACRGRNRGWSPSTWKTRLALNYKGIDYITEFLEMPQVEPTFEKLGIEANTTRIAYTLPIMRFPDGTYVMDSRKIADKIEEVWPDKPSLHLDSPIVAKVHDIEWESLQPLLAVIIPPVPRKMLNEESIAYYREKRAPYFGDLDQFEKEKGGEQAWAAAEEPWKKAAELLKEKGGPFFLGSTVSHADFYILSICFSLRQLGEGVLERILAFDPAIAELYRAGEPLSARDD